MKFDANSYAYFFSNLNQIQLVTSSSPSLRQSNAILGKDFNACEHTVDNVVDRLIREEGKKCKALPFVQIYCFALTLPSLIVLGKNLKEISKTCVTEWISFAEATKLIKSINKTYRCKVIYYDLDKFVMRLINIR